MKKILKIIGGVVTGIVVVGLVGTTAYCGYLSSHTFLIPVTGAMPGLKKPSRRSPLMVPEKST